MAKKRAAYRKRFGQIFLHDPLVIEKIVHRAHLAADDIVLEIGPGHGALTRALAQQGNTLYALELERRFIDLLHRHFSSASQVHIIQTDARTYDYSQLPAPLVVVANLPYSMSLPILRRLFVFRHRFSRLILMLQREVAARLGASPGSSAYGALSVYFQYQARIHCCFHVSRYAFTPVPAVDSSVLCLMPYSPLPWPSLDEAFFLHVVQSAFAHRRKTLRTNLLSALPLTKAQLSELFTLLHLTGTSRAQELHVSQFVQLATSLQPFVQSPGNT